MYLDNHEVDTVSTAILLNLLLLPPPYFSCTRYRNSLPNSSKTEILPTHFSACLFFLSEKEKAAPDIWMLAWDYQLDLGVVEVDLTFTAKALEFSCCT